MENPTSLIISMKIDFEDHKEPKNILVQDFFGQYPLPRFKKNQIQMLCDWLKNGQSSGKCLYDIGFSFPFFPKLLNEICKESAFVGDIESCYVLYSFLSWICFFERTKMIFHCDLVLRSLAMLCNSNYTILACTSFFFLLDILLDSISFQVSPQVVTMLNTFVRANKSFGHKSLILIRKSLQKILNIGEPVDDIYVQLINMVTYILGFKKIIVPSSLADSLINIIKPQIILLEMSSIICFEHLIKYSFGTSHSQIFEILPESIIDLMIMEANDPLPILDIQAEPPIVFSNIAPKHFIFTGIDAFPSGFPMKCFENIVFSSDSYQESSLITSILQKLLPSIVSNSVYAKLFLDSFSRKCHKEKCVPYNNILYQCFYKICLSFHTMDQGIKTIKYLLKSPIFDSRLTIFGGFGDFNYVNSLRSDSILLAMKEGQQSISDLMEYVIPYPKLFSDVILRFSWFSDSFSEMLFKDSKIFRFINKGISQYRKECFGDSVPISDLEIARNASLVFFDAVSIQNQIIDLVLTDTSVIVEIVCCLFEITVQIFALQIIKKILLKSNSKKVKNVIVPFVSLYSMINNNINENEYLSLGQLILDLLILVQQQRTDIYESLELLEDSMSITIFSMLPSPQSAKFIMSYMTFVVQNCSGYLHNANSLRILFESLLKIRDLVDIEELFNLVLLFISRTTKGVASPSFIISNGGLFHFVFSLFLNTAVFQKCILFITEMCRFSPDNAKNAHLDSIDEVVLSQIEKFSFNDIGGDLSLLCSLVSLFFAVSHVDSSPDYVHRYSCLLYPISKYNNHDIYNLFLRSLVNEIETSPESISKFLYLNRTGTKAYPMRFEDVSRNGLTITFWFLSSYDNNEDSFLLFSLKYSTQIRIEVKLVGTVIICSIFVNSKVYNTTICQDTSQRQWNFVSSSLNIVDSNFQISINLEKVHTFEISPLINDKNDIIVYIGAEKQSNDIIKLSYFVIYPLLPSHILSKLFLNGIYFSSIETFHPYYYVCPKASKRLTKVVNTSFTSLFLCTKYVIHVVCILSTSPCIIYDNDASTSLSYIFYLLSTIVSMIDDSEFHNSQDAIFCSLYYIIYSNQKTSFLLFKTIFSMFLGIMGSPYMLEFFQDLLCDPLLWINAIGNDHEKILSFWSNTLCGPMISFTSSIIDFDYVYDIIMMIYWNNNQIPPRSENLIMKRMILCNFNQAICRSYLKDVLIRITDHGFQSESFIFLVGYMILTCNEENSCYICEITNAIFGNIQSLKHSKISNNEVSVFHYLFSLNNDMFLSCGLDLLMLLYKFGYIPINELNQIIEYLISVINHSPSLQKLNHKAFLLLSEKNHEILSLCCFIATKEKNNLYIEQIKSYLSDEDCIVTSNQICMWILVFVFSFDSYIHNKMLKLLIDQLDINWLSLIPFVYLISKLSNNHPDILIYDLVYFSFQEMKKNAICYDSQVLEAVFWFITSRPRESCERCILSFSYEIPERNDLLTTHFEYDKAISILKKYSDLYSKGLRISKDFQWIDIGLAKEFVCFVLGASLTQFYSHATYLLSLILKIDSSFVSKTINAYNQEFKSPSVLNYISGLYNIKNEGITENTGFSTKVFACFSMIHTNNFNIFELIFNNTSKMIMNLVITLQSRSSAEYINVVNQKFQNIEKRIENRVNDAEFRINRCKDCFEAFQK